jgi:hypothetical protein
MPIPPVGTFRVYSGPDLIIFIGDWFSSVDPCGIAISFYKTLNANCTNPSLGTATGVFNRGQINIDGTDYIINDLPSGFTILTARYFHRIIDQNLSTYSIDINCSAGINETNVTAIQGIDSYPILVLTLLNIIGLNTFTHTFTVEDLAIIIQSGVGDVSQPYIEGIYTTLIWTITSSGPYGPGSHVIVTSPLINGLDFVHISSIALQYVDSNGNTKTLYINMNNGDVITRTTTQLEFIIPDYIPDAPSLTFDLSVVGDGTQFSGSISLGTLSILYSNGSGLYRIVKNKTSDTIYDRTNPPTAEIAIPNPFAETGYIGG